MGSKKTREYATHDAQGEHHHAKIMIDLTDVFSGAVHEVSLRMPTLDAQGHVHVRQRTSVQRARRMRTLERDFDAVPELAALVADLLEERDALRAHLLRAGMI